MRAAEHREHYEQLMLRVSAEVLGENGEFLLDPHDSQPGMARIRFTSRTHPDRAAGLTLDPEWLEAFFFLEPNLSIREMDDFSGDDEYATDHLRELVQVVHAYLRGEGSLESRRTVLGRRRPQMRFQVDGREWLAR